MLAGVPANMLIADETIGMVARTRPVRESGVVIIELLLDTLVETFELLWRLSIEVAVPVRGSSVVPQEPTDETRACCAAWRPG